jgi:hypothetical protein
MLTCETFLEGVGAENAVVAVLPGLRGRAIGRAVPLDRTMQQCPETLPWLVRLRFGTR